MTREDALDALYKIRLASGVKEPAAFMRLTVTEIVRALMRETWCVHHGGHRDTACPICEALK